jgi:hypothetical protein
MGIGTESALIRFPGFRTSMPQQYSSPAAFRAQVCVLELTIDCAPADDIAEKNTALLSTSRRSSITTNVSVVSL